MTDLRMRAYLTVCAFIATILLIATGVITEASFDTISFVIGFSSAIFLVSVTVWIKAAGRSDETKQTNDIKAP